MAGAGYKSFTAGAVLGASDVNTYLMQQTVMVFADTTSRDAAIPSPSAGMQVWLTSTASQYQYTGSAWVPVAPFTLQANGSSSVTTASASPWSTGTVAVTNLTRFTQAPNVVATANYSSSNPIVVQVSGITTTGFTIRATIYASLAVSIPVAWVAIQMQTGNANG